MPKNRTDLFAELAALADCDGFYEAGWRERFAPFVEFSAFLAKFLDFTGEYTHWMYCPERSRCEHCCPFEIVQDENGYYAVCVEGKRPPLPVAGEDIRMLAFNFTSFHRKLAEALPVDPAVDRISDGLSWQLGTLCYGREMRRRVCITYVSPRELAGEIVRLSAGDILPVIVFTPYRFALRRDDNLVLRVVDVIILPVNEIVELDRDCRFSPTPEFSRQIRELLNDSDKPTDSPRGISLPSGIAWEDIRVRFLDAHTVSCRINKTVMTMSFHDLGMVNRKNGKPDKNWLYLMQFAAQEGKLRVDWQMPSRALREQQRKRRLSKALQAFFHIDSEPIVFDRETFSYICKFRLKPEGEVTRYRAPLK